MIHIDPLAFVPSLKNLTSLKILKLKNLAMYSEIPAQIDRLRRLEVLNLSNNKLQGEIPKELSNCTNIKVLVFLVNRFTGRVPTWFGSMKQLTILILETNNLVGTIPSSLKNVSSLQLLTLTEMLSIAKNKLIGDLPNQLFRYLDGLIYIYLYNNSFTGPIPSEFGSLKHLSQLYLNSNNLSGEIPKDLASCLSLTGLWLGENFLYGSIPLFLASFKSLEVLDISNNNFSSTIPFELENLAFLNTLDMSFNNLYVEVPKKGVFSNVAKVSLIGNKNLCGGISQLKLLPCLKIPSKKHKRSLKKKLIIIGVSGGILISFIAFIIVHFLTINSKKLPSSPTLQNNGVTYGELHEASNGFSSANLIGTGNFGSVYKGSLLNFETPIAVKGLNLETRRATKSFVVECNALGKMKHRNLVKILTCCSSVDYKGEDFKATIFEFMPNESLEKFLHDTEGFENHSLSLTQKVDIAFDVAHALNYLHHDEDQVVVHCDVKPNNVLLDEDIVAHLGDFGLARLIHGATEHSSKDQVSSSTIKGTIGYLPPEY
ncbi:unnamed protein product [Lathyrus sativus]|nr:unnamed protein product [Lathyrus sativus]